MFCNYLNVTFFLLLLAYLRKWIARWTFVVGISAVTICAVFTISAGLGAFVLSIALSISCVYLRTRKWISRLILTSGVVGAVALTALSFVELNASSPSGLFSPSARVEIWKQALETITRHPYTGNGLGTPVVEVVYINAEGTASLLTDAHNVFLNVGAGSGLLAAAALFALCIFLVRSVVVDRRNSLSKVQTWLIAAFIAAFVIQGLTGSFEDARHLWVLIGLMLSAEGIDKEAEI